MMKSYARILAVLGGYMMSWVIGLNAAQFGLINAERVNVRTQPSIVSEVVTQMNTGDRVQVLERISLDDTIPGNPKEWCRIAVPEGAAFWVSGDYIDPNDDTVTASQLNVRAGPGQSYTVMARLIRGDKVQRIRESDGWVSIKPPAEAFAYVATSLVDFLDETAESGPSASETPAEKTSAVTEPPPVLIVDDPHSGETQIIQSTIERDQPDEASTTEVTQASEPELSFNELVNEESTATPPPAAVASEKEAQDAQPIDDEPVQLIANETRDRMNSGLTPLEIPIPKNTNENRLPPEIVMAENPSDPTDALRRIVTREGIVKRSRSIQSPTYHRLEDPDSHRTMNYLYTGRLHLHTQPSSADLAPYEGYKIRVTGTESVDPRWPRIPVIEIEELNLTE